MQTGLKRVVSPAPTRGQSSGRVVHFKDLCLITASLCINSGATARNAPANDDDLPSIFFPVCDTPFRPVALDNAQCPPPIRPRPGRSTQSDFAILVWSGQRLKIVNINLRALEVGILIDDSSL